MRRETRRAREGVRAKIAAPPKIAKIRAYGADVHVEGADYFEAQALCDKYVEATGALKIHPYEAPETIAGQGTVALEWEEDLGASARRRSMSCSSRSAAAGLSPA